MATDNKESTHDGSHYSVEHDTKHPVGFFDFPREVRDMIYEDMLVDKQFFHATGTRPRLVIYNLPDENLSLVSRQFKQELMETAKGRVYAVVNGDDALFNGCSFKIKGLQHISRIELSYRISAFPTVFTRRLLEISKTGKLFLKRKVFPNLESFSISVHVGLWEEYEAIALMRQYSRKLLGRLAVDKRFRRVDLFVLDAYRAVSFPHSDSKLMMSDSGADGKLEWVNENDTSW